MKFFTIKLLLMLSVFASFSVMAHHSFVALYFVDDEVTIEGRIVQFSIRNPHSFLHVSAPDENGEAQRWAIEWGGVTSLGRINRDTLKPGDEVVVMGNPSRDPGSHRLRMLKINRPSDDWEWSGTFD